MNFNKKTVFTVLIGLWVTLLISACSENDIPTPPHLLIPDERDAQADELKGVWRVSDVVPGCDEIIDFGQASDEAINSESSIINMRIQSADEVLSLGYQQTPEFERDQLNFNVKIDSGGVDCLGNSAAENFGLSQESVHQFFGPFYLEKDTASGSGLVTLTLHPTPTSADVITQMTYVEQDLSSSFSGTESLSIVSLTPDEAREGITTSFVINIAYETNEVIPPATTTMPRIEIGLNNLFRDDYELIRSEEIEVGGPRELLLLLEGDPLIWGEGNTYAVRVTMFNSLGEEVARVYQSIAVKK